MDRRTYFDAEPWYRRENTRDWYQQMEATNQELTSILAGLPIEGMTITEVACGVGWLAEHLCQRNPKSYVGVDFAETGVANARARVALFSWSRSFKVAVACS